MFLKKISDICDCWTLCSIHFQVVIRMDQKNCGVHPMGWFLYGLVAVPKAASRMAACLVLGSGPGRDTGRLWTVIVSWRIAQKGMMTISSFGYHGIPHRFCLGIYMSTLYSIVRVFLLMFYTIDAHMYSYGCVIYIYALSMYANAQGFPVRVKWGYDWGPPTSPIPLPQAETHRMTHQNLDMMT